MRIKDLDSETKTTLELLIRQILDVVGFPNLRVGTLQSEILEVLDPWIKANDLHPERIQIFGPFQSSNASNETHWNIMNSTFDFTIEKKD
jgi:hypothetical protein